MQKLKLSDEKTANLVPNSKNINFLFNFKNRNSEKNVFKIIFKIFNKNVKIFIKSLLKCIFGSSF